MNHTVIHRMEIAIGRLQIGKPLNSRAMFHTKSSELETFLAELSCQIKMSGTVWTGKSQRKNLESSKFDTQFDQKTIKTVPTWFKNRKLA